VRILENPNLPEAALHIAIGGKYANFLEKPLLNLGLTPIFVPENPHVHPDLSGHTDLSIVHTGGKGIWLAPFLRGSRLSDALKTLGFEVNFPDIVQSSKYPADAGMNIMCCGKYALYSHGCSAHEIVADFKNKGYTMLNSRQGYARCSCCIVSENAVICSDRGIYTALKDSDLDVLLIEPGHISLPGYEYGFIGGSAFKISRDHLAFTGKLDLHPDKQRIMDFLKNHSVQPIYLSNRPIFDIGSAVPLTEK